jgi:chemotaxis protein CheD
MKQTLHPGDVACGERGDRLETLLGSCVAVVLTDPRRSVGAMCHIVHARPASRPSGHPAWTGDGVPTQPCAQPATAHADAALAALYALLRQRGITPGLCEAYVYGGGNMFPDLIQAGHVGDDNVRWVLDALADDGVRVLHADVGGHSYRRLAWTVGPELPQVTAVAI